MAGPSPRSSGARSRRSRGSATGPRSTRWSAQSIELGHQPMLKLRTGQCWATQPPTVGDRDTTEAASEDPLDAADRHRGLPGVRDRGRAALRRPGRARVRRRERGRRRELLGDRRGGVRAPWCASVVPAIRAADPEARVLDAGLSSTSYGVVLAADQLAAGDDEGAAPDLPGPLRPASRQRRLPLAGRRPPSTSCAAVLAGVPAQRSIAAEDVSVRLAHDGVVDAYQLHYYEPIVRAARAARPPPGAASATACRSRRGRSAWPGPATTYDERAHADEVFRAGGHAAGARRAPHRLPAGRLHPGRQDPGVPRPDPRGRLRAALRAGLARPQRRAEGPRRGRPPPP